MLISYEGLIELVNTGVITADESNINASSIDITLGDLILFESKLGGAVDLAAKQNIKLDKWDMATQGRYVLAPNEFVLASSVEVFNLPDGVQCEFRGAAVSAEYKLKSSMARNGLEHLNAGWCDPGWHGSMLTLELKNMAQYHSLILTPRMKIGQMVFFASEAVPDHASYAKKGQYNHQASTTESKGLR